MNRLIFYITNMLACIICFQLGIYIESKRIAKRIYVQVKAEGKEVEEALERAWHEGWNACEEFYQQEKHGS